MDLAAAPPAVWTERLGAVTDRALPRQPQPAAHPEAAVLALLDPSRDGGALLFIERPGTMRHHAGQIALPGGGREPRDPTLIETALREAAEEVGIAPAEVTVAGTLSPMVTHSSERWLVPVVGVAARPVQVRPQLAEVASHFWVGLERLAAAPHEVRPWGPSEDPRRVHFYEVDGRVIWGVTGQIVADLLDRIAAVS